MIQCHERLGTLERLCEHMFQVHRAPTEIKRKVFDTEAQFEVSELHVTFFGIQMGNRITK